MSWRTDFRCPIVDHIVSTRPVQHNRGINYRKGLETITGETAKMGADPNAIVSLTESEKGRIVQALATCPFVGSAVAERRLAVRNDGVGPLASIEDVREMGNSGGGDLGEVLVLFATGNHAFMRGQSGRLDSPVPAGLFSLEFPGSQGAHPGHSGILMGDPKTPGSGRFSQEAFARLAAKAKDGRLKRSDAAVFIAENLARDPDAKVAGPGVAQALGVGLVALGTSVATTLVGKLTGSGEGSFEKTFTKLAGEDNLVGSSGEFGLLFAFVANRPGAMEIDGEPTVSIDDLESMFVRKRLPEGFENWRKTRADWVRNSLQLAIGAARSFHGLSQAKRAD